MKFPLLLLTIIVGCTALTLRAHEAHAAYGPAVTARVILQTQTDGTGAKFHYPVDAPAEVTLLQVEIAVGQQTGWHIHPIPCFAYVIEGALTVETDTGSNRAFKAGDALAEVINVRHNGINTGTTPVRLLFFAVSTAGQPYAVSTPIPAK
ncbi:MAG: cupin domain-containing protein [Opitutaceae bacterium]|nr:cupin domain-containing protein [Opitutaceae bacterium]